jgi:hypothetical protein
VWPLSEVSTRARCGLEPGVTFERGVDSERGVDERARVDSELGQLGGI